MKLSQSTRKRASGSGHTATKQYYNIPRKRIRQFGSLVGGIAIGAHDTESAGIPGAHPADSTGTEIGRKS